jgi:topoisomerase-4 subunit A
MKEKGVSTLGGRTIWFDEDVMRLNVDARGTFLGEFSGDDSLLVITKSGNFRTCNFDLSNHFEDDLIIIEKYREGKIWSAAYYDAEQEYYYLKRFLIEPGAKETRFIGEHPESRLIRITEVEYPRLELKFGGKNKDRNSEIIEVADFIGIKSHKARGKRLSNYEVKVIEELQPKNTPSEEVDPEQKEDSPVDVKVKKPKPEKDLPEKKIPPAAVPEKETTPVKKASKSTKTGPAKQKQDPDEVPLEIVKPKENKKGGDDHDEDGKPNGQFTLEW